MLINNVGVSYPYAMFFHELGEYNRAIKAPFVFFHFCLLHFYKTLSHQNKPTLPSHTLCQHTHARTHYLSS